MTSETKLLSKANKFKRFGMIGTFREIYIRKVTRRGLRLREGNSTWRREKGVDKIEFSDSPDPSFLFKKKRKSRGMVVAFSRITLFTLKV